MVTLDVAASVAFESERVCGIELRLLELSSAPADADCAGRPWALAPARSYGDRAYVWRSQALCRERIGKGEHGRFERSRIAIFGVASRNPSMRCPRRHSWLRRWRDGHARRAEQSYTASRCCSAHFAQPPYDDCGGGIANGGPQVPMGPPLAQRQRALLRRPCRLSGCNKRRQDCAHDIARDRTAANQEARERNQQYGGIEPLARRVRAATANERAKVSPGGGGAARGFARHRPRSATRRRLGFADGWKQSRRGFRHSDLLSRFADIRFAGRCGEGSELGRYSIDNFLSISKLTKISLLMVSTCWNRPRNALIRAAT